MPELLDAVLDAADDVLVQPARPLLAVAGDEWDGIAFIEKPDHLLDLGLSNLQVLGDPGQVQGQRRLGRQRGGSVHSEMRSVRRPHVQRAARAVGNGASEFYEIDRPRAREDRCRLHARPDRYDRMAL